MKRIGLIGLGSMGAPMGRRLLQAGFSLTVCDREEAKAAALVKAGAVAAGSPAGCGGCGMVLVAVSDDDQVRDVLDGRVGLLRTAEEGMLVAVMSTVLPATIRSMGEACRSRGVRLIDGPVSGFPVLAEAGKLTIMAGGAAEDVEAAREVFDVLGESIVHMGALGSGATVKLLNNMIGLPAMLLAPLAMHMAKAAGLDAALAAGVIEKSTGRNFMTADWERARAVARIFSSSVEASEATMGIARKDMEHALRLAQSLGVEHTFLRRVVEAMTEAPAQEFYRDLRAMQ